MESTLIQDNKGAADKKKILAQIEDHFDHLYRMHPRTSLCSVYFNGSSMVCEDRESSGRWACANNQFIGVDEIVDIFSEVCPVTHI